MAMLPDDTVEYCDKDYTVAQAIEELRTSRAAIDHAIYNMPTG